MGTDNNGETGGNSRETGAAEVRAGVWLLIFNSREQMEETMRETPALRKAVRALRSALPGGTFTETPCVVVAALPTRLPEPIVWVIERAEGRHDGMTVLLARVEDLAADAEASAGP